MKTISKFNIFKQIPPSAPPLIRQAEVIHTTFLTYSGSLKETRNAYQAFKANSYLGEIGKMPLNLVRLYRGNFAIFDSIPEGPSAQALEIIRHVDASFYRKKSRWDYQFSLVISLSISFSPPYLWYYSL